MSEPLTPLDYHPLDTLDSLSPGKTKQILEAALFTTQEPLSVSELRKLFNDELSAAVLTNLL